MWSTRDIIFFLAGAEAFHTVSHIAMNYLGILPIKCCGITWTKRLNTLSIIINALITIALLWWAQSK